MPDPLRAARLLFPVSLLALAGLVVGCGGADEIRSYKVPRTAEATDRAAPVPVAQGPERVRLLAAIIPTPDGRSYFVKMLGPIDQIAAHEEAFNAFLNSIRLTNDPAKPITWTPPPGAKELPARQLRVVTFAFGPPGQAPEVYISAPFAGTLLANLNRWRKQDVGLKDLTEAEVGGATQVIDLGGTKAHRVDYRGPGGTGGMGGPFMKGGK